MPKSTLEKLSRRIKKLEQENHSLKQAQARLKEHEEYLLAILDNAPAPIYLKDTDYRYILVNKYYEMLAHVSLDEIRGKTDYDIYPEDIAGLFRSQDEAVKRKNAHVEFEETVPLEDGAHTFITSKFPVNDADGNIDAIGGFCTDITERKKIEEEKEKLITELQKALAEVKILRGILPICASCKKVRDDNGYWSQIESYVKKHSEAEFTHGVCPECVEKIYGKEKWYKKRK